MSDESLPIPQFRAIIITKPPKQFSQARAVLFVANGDKCAYSDEIGLQPPKDNMYIYERIIQ